MNVFLKSALVQPPRVLGVRLRPFSAWHALVLAALENPYAVGGERSTSALIEGVLVCRNPWHPGGDPLPSLLRFSRSRWCRFLWWWRCVARNIDRATDEFGRYVVEYQRHPTYWESTSGAAERSGVPLPFYVSHILSAYCGMDESRAWNMPLSMALCHVAAVAESKGASVADAELAAAARILDGEAA